MARNLHAGSHEDVTYFITWIPRPIIRWPIQFIRAIRYRWEGDPTGELQPALDTARSVTGKKAIHLIFLRAVGDWLQLLVLSQFTKSHRELSRINLSQFRFDHTRCLSSVSSKQLQSTPSSPSTHTYTHTARGSFRRVKNRVNAIKIPRNTFP